MCISMELVTTVLGDHGQRPNEEFGTKCFSSLIFFGFLLMLKYLFFLTKGKNSSIKSNANNSCSFKVTHLNIQCL